MPSNATYYSVMVLVALAVIITCGAGITWNYFSAARWSERKKPQPDAREHRETSPSADQSADREERKLAA